MTTTLGTQIRWIRQRWQLVAAVTVLSVLAALATTFGAATEYTGKSALIVSSRNRAPEQDAVLVRGYIELFNDPAYLARIRAAAQVPDEVTLEARTAASSPIVYIAATADDADLAATSATAAAEAFRDDMNAVQRAGREDAVAELRRQLEQEQATSGPPPPGVVNTPLTQLQDHILSIETDTTNALQDLQLRAGVEASPPDPVKNAVLGLLGGLVLGCVAALGAAALSNRLRDPDDVHERTGLDVLATIPRGGRPPADRVRAEHLRRLANTIAVADLPRPLAVAVVPVDPGSDGAPIARALAEHRARQGEKTLLVRADLRTGPGGGAQGPGSRGTGAQGTGARDTGARGTGFGDAPFAAGGGPGIADCLGDTDPLPIRAVIHDTEVPGLREIRPGYTTGDPYEIFGPDRLERFLRQARVLADLVVVEAPAVNGAAETQLICAAVDTTVLVVAQGRTRTPAAVDAVALLERARANVLGAVLVDVRPPTATSAPAPARSDAASDDAPSLDPEGASHGRVDSPAVD